jgi:hypothetical protein
MKLKRIQKLKQDGRLENVPKLGTKNPNYGKNEREGQDAKRNCSEKFKSRGKDGCDPYVTNGYVGFGFKPPPILAMVSQNQYNRTNE